MDDERTLPTRIALLEREVVTLNNRTNGIDAEVSALHESHHALREAFVESRGAQRIAMLIGSFFSGILGATIVGVLTAYILKNSGS